ncbi:hypothetical protein [Salinarchaeum sp. Harcht-Bsk1]|uniref:DUF7284 family protein n=1 Tax=Salinarchaeum sp. Harcht-Bsk1 TaxID=1333523 RepID=UPI001181889E|nr:hypothetical protein [Salinarchaeum sp. Harcht-Bsk1]
MIRCIAPSAAQNRAISTVLDAAIFLLLVSAAIGLLYTVPQTGDDARADPDVAAETTTTLATSIATIDYVPTADGDADSSTTNRSDRGTITELLAETTVANAELRGEAFTRAPNHEAAVRNATRRTIRRIDGDVEVQVRTRWRPLSGSGLRGGIVVGPSPPADADVHAATMRVPVGTGTSVGAARPDWFAPTAPPWTELETVESADDRRFGRRTSLETVTARGDCRGLAGVLAARAVGTAFPPEQTAIAMREESNAAEAIETRYVTAGRALGLRQDGLPLNDDVRHLSGFLAGELAAPFQAACEGYETPEIAASRAAPEIVTVSVRTWSP